MTRFALGFISSPARFAGGAADVVAGSIKEACELMATGADQTIRAGGNLTINGVALGGYDYKIITGPITITTFTAADWFTATQDSRSAFVIVKGDLTVSGGVTFTPAVRKLFMAVHVTGKLEIVNPARITMSQRGANHSAATGSNFSGRAIRIATGTLSGVVNPEVPAAGAAGGAGKVAGAGNVGGAGTAGQTGGGGSGGDRNGTGSAAGAAGTSFSGGPATGAGSYPGAGTPCGIDGGVGGAMTTTAGNQAGGGGAGNPGGAGGNGGGGAVGNAGSPGTGGIQILICGIFAGAGFCFAAGASGGGTGGTLSADAGGGGSGGGSNTVIYGSDISTITPTAGGGVGATPNYNGAGYKGGDGGAGTARKLAT